MIKLTLKEMIAVTSAKTLHFKSDFEQTEIATITIDSRKVEKGNVFIALKGEQFDGHDFTQQAIEQGAIVLIVEKQLPIDFPMIIVKDARTAMAQIAHLLRQKSEAIFIALTGSSGKTSVKEMTASILQLEGNTLFTQGNLNNEIGVPLTLFRLDKKNEFAVIELGANHQNEIAWTTKIVQPDIALINNVAAAHLEGFGSIEDVFKAKGEIFAGLKETGTGLVNLDNFSPNWTPTYFDNTNRTYQTFSIHDKTADYYAHSVCMLTQEQKTVTQFQLVTPKGECSIELPLLGLHNVSNAVASAALAQLAGSSFDKIQKGIAILKPVSGRLNPISLTDKIMIIDDTYNANVASMKAAISVLAQQKGKLIFVVGDMGELGEHAFSLHQEVGEFAKQNKIENIFSVGKWSEQITVHAQNGQHFMNQDSLIAALKKELVNEFENENALTILVKGSRSSKMEEIIKALQVEFLV